MSAVKATCTKLELGLVTVGVVNAFNVINAVEVPETVDPKLSAAPFVVAVTVYEYEVLLVSPVTVQLCEPVGTVVVFATTHAVPLPPVT